MTASARRFGRFELLARLGAGGAGEVLLVDDGGRRLALKRLLPHLDGAAAAGAFEREGALAARLAHRNIVQVIEHGHVDGAPYVLMEYVDGVSLHALVRRAGRLPPQVAGFVVAEACRALAYLHQLDDGAGRAMALVHRDVSPSNVLVSRAGEVKLCDFGIAKATATTATRTVPGFVKGKRGYRAPEQESRSALDARSDVYGAGVVLFEALTGRRPRDDDERPSRAMANLPPVIDDVCVRARASDPSARLPSAAAMAAALDAVVAPAQAANELRAIVCALFPAPAAASEATRTRTLARLGGRRLSVAVAAAAAALVVLGALALTQRRQAAPPATAPPPPLATPSPPPLAPTTPPLAPPSPPPLAPTTTPRATPSPPPLATPSPPPIAAPPASMRAHAKRAHRPPPAKRASDYMPDPFRR